MQLPANRILCYHSEPTRGEPEASLESESNGQLHDYSRAKFSSRVCIYYLYTVYRSIPVYTVQYLYRACTHANGRLGHGHVCLGGAQYILL